ncbi:NlpC/P60 family protein [Microbacterium sediminis]|uniref:Uncharacterized protein n=1 Tax=Microbacterium sediminis TaxID=904291 RepID=A0A1B9NIY2_9MICO|nr:NlpC/P60 family protein [Microbacterium sediminis]OCG76567.1 hypothetical protein A7J15_11325 [Microbacterium sediminis]QBR73829.1 hypothetical protein E3O41_04925 [Microbacterium sediminis]
MSVAAISERIGTIQSLIQELANPAASTGAATGTAQAAGTTATDFASALRTLGALPDTSDGVTGEDIVEQATQYLGVPYVFGGEDETGMDCSGLVQRVLADLGIDAPRVVQDQADIGVEVPSLEEAQPGDLIVTKDEGHIVIYAGDGKIIHAPRPGKDVQLVDNYLSPSEIGTIRRVVPAASEAAPATASLAGLTSLPSSDLLSVMQVLFAGGADAAGDDALGSLSATLAPIAAALEARAAAASTAAVATPAPALVASAAAAAAMATPVAPTSDDPAPSRRDDLAVATAAPASAPDTRAASAPAAATAPRPALAPQLSPPLVSLAQAGDGDHQLTLTVSPDDLGPVTVRAHISGDVMRIELLAPSDAGRDAIRHILGDLRRDLAAAAPHASLTLASGDGSATAQSGADTGSAARDGGSGRSQGEASPRGPVAREAVPVPVAAPIVPLSHTATSFDVLA